MTLQDIAMLAVSALLMSTWYTRYCVRRNSDMTANGWFQILVVSLLRDF